MGKMPLLTAMFRSEFVNLLVGCNQLKICQGTDAPLLPSLQKTSLVLSPWSWRTEVELLRVSAIISNGTVKEFDRTLEVIKDKFTLDSSTAG